ncbi:MAG TPA: hypothetical protein PKA58_08315, partial [Polyangium sp.]|nr:hypothetical protein [Polyangium sp.]
VASPHAPTHTGAANAATTPTSVATPTATQTAAPASTETAAPAASASASAGKSSARTPPPSGPATKGTGTAKGTNDNLPRVRDPGF